MIIAGGLDRRNVGFVGDTSGVVFDGRAFGHDDLAGGGKWSIVSRRGKVIASADIGSDTATINTYGVETETVG